MISKKAVSLPVNVVVMMIIGIVIFALGMSLFSKIYISGEKELEGLRGEIKNDIAALECDGDNWLCTPSYKLGNGKTETFEIYVSNHGDTVETFNIELILTNPEGDGKKFIESPECGDLNILFLEYIDLEIESGNSAQIPFIAKATRVTDTPCSFITTAILRDNVGDEVDRTSVIIRVE